jgi:hypothetical protein
MAAKASGLATANSMRTPLLRFGVGVLLGALAFGVRYLSQALFALDKKRAGQIANSISIALAVAGYVVFGWGLAGASDGIGVKDA